MSWMAREVTEDWDNFAVGISKLIGDIPSACSDKLGKAVKQSVRKTAKGLRGGEFGSSGKHEWSERYMSGFASHTDTRAFFAEGQVGNKNKPGLVHLLEKGHATLTARRTTAYPQMAPAFDDMEQDFMERAERAIGEALGG